MQIKRSLRTLIWKCVLAKGASSLRNILYEKIRALFSRNLSSLQHPETTLETTLRNTHWPTSLSWVDKHWDDLRMYLLLISFTPTPLNLPASVLYPALSLRHILLAIVLFIKLCITLAPPSLFLLVILGCENMAARSWWETEGACCLSWLLWLSVLVWRLDRPLLL